MLYYLVLKVQNKSIILNVRCLNGNFLSQTIVQLNIEIGYKTN